jgi:transposase
MAYPYPKEMRSTRDLLRRRHRLVRIRGESYTHMHIICHQQGCPDISSQALKGQSTHRELTSRFNERSLQNTISADLDMIDILTPFINQLEKEIRHQAKSHNHRDYALLQTTPGIGDRWQTYPGKWV